MMPTRVQHRGRPAKSPALHQGTSARYCEVFGPLFPKALIEQEMSAERYIDIPGEVLDVYRAWRPSRCFAPAVWNKCSIRRQIYYKYEGVSPARSHKPNTAVPQVWYNAPGRA